MKTFVAVIDGTAALLMHRFAEEAEASTRKATRRNATAAAVDPREEAEKCAYRHKDGTLYIPGAAFSRLLREAAGGHKARGSRKSMKYVLPTAVRVTDEIVALFEDGEPADDFEVDARPVVIPSTRGRVMRFRPRLEKWQARVAVSVDEDLVDAKFVHQLLEEGGKQIGVGDFRPERGGPFGTFRVISWKELK